MSSLNKVILVGHLGSDPELRRTQTNEPVCSLSLATSRSWKNAQGEREERTSWHRISVWGREAEVCSQNLTKGSLVGIEGSYEQRDYVNKEGVTQRTMEVRCQRVTFLGSKKDGQSRPGARPAPARSPANQAGYGYPEEPPMPDQDIPF